VGDQGTSFGAYQLHQGGALGSLSPQAAFDPYTNAMAVLPSWAKAGGGRGLTDQAALLQYYSKVGRGSSNTIPTQHALALIPQARQLLGQTPIPAVGSQPNANPATATGSPHAGLSPALTAGLQHWLAQSSREAAAGKYGGNFMDSPLFKQLVQARAQMSMSGQTAPQTAQMPGQRFTGAIPGPVKRVDYPLGAKGPIIGVPYQGTHTLFGNWESDKAVDIKVPTGTPVVAPADGVIGSQIGALNSADPKLQGLRVHLDSPTDNFYFAHLSRLAVKPGEHVRAGQVIGYSGAANGVQHLHFASQNRDPRAYVGG
jgi:murein DD-endopeptidase MepM/ murein hydrolase activator NlpD